MAKKPRNLVQKKWRIWHKNFTGKIWLIAKRTRRKSVIRWVNFKFSQNSIFDPFSIWRPKNVSVTFHGKNPIPHRQRSSSAARLHKKNENSKFAFFPKLCCGKVWFHRQNVPKMEIGQFSTNMVERPLVLKPSTRKNFWWKNYAPTSLHCEAAALQSSFRQSNICLQPKCHSKMVKIAENMPCDGSSDSARHAEVNYEKITRLARRCSERLHAKVLHVQVHSSHIQISRLRANAKGTWHYWVL